MLLGRRKEDGVREEVGGVPSCGVTWEMDDLTNWTIQTHQANCAP